MFSLKINGRVLERFNEINIALKYDSVASTFNFQYYFDPNESPYFNFGSYDRVELFSDGELLLTGTVLSMSHAEGSDKTLSQVSGYSVPGVLEDCQMPVKAYPLQRNGLTLAQVCRELAGLFSIPVVVDSDVSGAANGVISETAAEPTTTIKAYLATLASHRNVILSHTEKGELLLTRAKAKSAPFTVINPGDYLSMSIEFPGQGMHSEITAMIQAGTGGGNAGQFTVTNPYVRGSYRPKVFTVDTGNDNTPRSSAERELANEVNQVVLRIRFASWYLAGELLKPNKVIKLRNPEIAIFSDMNWFIEEVNFSGNESQQVSEIKCVLPESYNGQVARVNNLVV